MTFITNVGYSHGFCYNLTVVYVVLHNPDFVLQLQKKCDNLLAFGMSPPLLEILCKLLKY